MQQLRKPNMETAVQVRRIYEKFPYPAAGKKVWRRGVRQLPSMEWIDALWQPPHIFPQRILVAGCGTGQEAFAIARRFKHSEVVAVDFSPRSVAIARNRQKRAPESRHLRFIIGDIASKEFANIVGNDFDFISCHGVLSYVPQMGQALHNLARCLKPDGTLYLGVNGITHFSATWRPALDELGFQLVKFRDGKRLRDVLKLCDALGGFHATRIINQDAGYLAGDLFGPLIHNWPLERWTALARRAGLHFLGSYGAHRALGPILNDGSYRRLLPRARAQAHTFVELLSPSSFHSLLFGRQPQPNPPWQNPPNFLRWRARLTDLYTFHWPKRRRLWQKLRRFQLKSVSTNTVVDLSVPEWELEILRQADGKRSLAESLAGFAIGIPAAAIRDALYGLYLLALLNLSPPK